MQWAGGNEIEGIVTGINQTQANGTHYLDEVRLISGMTSHKSLTSHFDNIVPISIRTILA